MAVKWLEIKYMFVYLLVLLYRRFLGDYRLYGSVAGVELRLSGG